MPRKYKQVAVTIYPETEKLLHDVMKTTDNLQASVLRQALNLGLKQILAKQPSSQLQQSKCSISVEEMKRAMREVLEEQNSANECIESGTEIQVFSRFSRSKYYLELQAHMNKLLYNGQAQHLNLSYFAPGLCQLSVDGQLVASGSHWQVLSELRAKYPDNH